MYFSSLMGGGTGTTAPKYGSGSGIGGLLGGPQFPMAAKQNTGNGPIPSAPAQLPKGGTDTLSMLTQSPLALSQLKSLLGGGSAAGSNGNMLNYDRTLFGYGPNDFGGGSEYGSGSSLFGGGASGGGSGGLLGNLLSYL